MLHLTRSSLCLGYSPSDITSRRVCSPRPIRVQFSLNRNCYISIFNVEKFRPQESNLSARNGRKSFLTVCRRSAALFQPTTRHTSHHLQETALTLDFALLCTNNKKKNIFVYSFNCSFNSFSI